VLDKAEYSAFESTLNSPIVSYRIQNYKLGVVSTIQLFVRFVTYDRSVNVVHGAHKAY